MYTKCLELYFNCLLMPFLAISVLWLFLTVIVCDNDISWSYSLIILGKRWKWICHNEVVTIHRAIGWSAVCVFVVYWSYLFFEAIDRTKLVLMKWYLNTILSLVLIFNCKSKYHMTNLLAHRRQLPYQNLIVQYNLEHLNSNGSKYSLIRIKFRTQWMKWIGPNCELFP